MTFNDHFGLIRLRKTSLDGTIGICAVAAMIGVLFAGSTVVTPLYVVYKQQFGFSQITLTLIYAAYVLGNLAALLLFGRLSDEIGRRRTAMIAMAIAIVSAVVFLFARGVAALYAGRILSGLAIGIGAGTATAWLAELVGRPRQVGRHRDRDQHELPRAGSWRADVGRSGGIRIIAVAAPIHPLSADTRGDIGAGLVHA